MVILKPTTYVWIILALLVVKVLEMGFVEALGISTDDNYQTECIMHDPPTPVDYESYYRQGPVYIVIYEGRTRWNDEKCEERKSVGVTEYGQAKAIVGEKE